MKVIEIPVDMLREALWNANQMDDAMLERLRRWSDRGTIRSFRVSTKGDRRHYKKDVTRFLNERAK